MNIYKNIFKRQGLPVIKIKFPIYSYSVSGGLDDNQQECVS